MLRQTKQWLLRNIFFDNMNSVHYGRYRADPNPKRTPGETTKPSEKMSHDLRRPSTMILPVSCS